MASNTYRRKISQWLVGGHAKSAEPGVRRGALWLVVSALLAGAAVALAPSAVFAADTSAPTEPGTITVSGVTATGASLRWGHSTDDVGIEGYRVYRGPTASALSLIATTDAVTSYTATNLRSRYAYTFGVVAIDAANNKSAMRTTTLTTLTSSDTTSPAAPSSGSVSVKAFSSSRIDVIWGRSSSTDVAYYLVSRDGAVVATVERPNAQRFSDNNLAVSSSHSYTIIAVDSAGNMSPPTTAKSATTLSATTVKIARGPYLSVVTDASAIVSWWTNIATTGVVSMAGQSVTDPAGSVQHHAVTVSGLSAGTMYAYTVSSGSASSSGSLRTAANPGATFSFAAIGDFGSQSPGEAQNASNIGSSGTQFIQTLGDNIYPSAGLPDPNFTTTYSDFDARFYKQFGLALKSQAFFPANGNKEYYGDGEFWENFPMLGANHSWYSYNWGDAHILVLDSEQPLATGTAQYNFAQNDLATHQNDAWRIVAIQRPPYSSTTANSSSKPVQQYLVPLFQTQNVNLVLSGNSHNYERSYPLVDGAPVTSGGVTYIVSGAGGNGFNAFNDTTFPKPTWSAFRESSYYQYAKVTVSPTSLVVAAVRADTNAVFDTTTITKAGGDTAPPSAPSGLTAGTPTASTVPLIWNANPTDDGVASYNVYRDSVKVAGLTGTSFTDTGLVASTAYTYTLTAVDAAGNESPQSGPVTAATAAGSSTTVTLTPTDDATIDPVITDTLTSSRIKADASSPTNDMLLKFSSNCTKVTAANLQLTVGSGINDPSGHGGDFYATSPSDQYAGWAEGTVAWGTAPAKNTAITPVSLGAVAANTGYSIDITRLVPSTGGTFTIYATSTSGDGAGYYSKEGSTTSGPKLQLTCG